MSAWSCTRASRREQEVEVRKLRDQPDPAAPRRNVSVHLKKITKRRPHRFPVGFYSYSLLFASS